MIGLKNTKWEMVGLECQLLYIPFIYSPCTNIIMNVEPSMTSTPSVSHISLSKLMGDNFINIYRFPLGEASFASKV